MASLIQRCTLRLAELIKNGEKWPFEIVLPYQIGDEVMKALQEICIIDENILERLAETTLEISKCKVSVQPVNDVVLSPLKKYKNLQSLRIEYADTVYEDEIQCYCLDLVRFVDETILSKARDSLRSLEIIGYTEIYSWIGLGQLPNLEHLSVKLSQVFNQNLVQGAQYLPSLRWLDISGSRVTELCWLANLPNLEALILHNCPITDENAAEDLQILSKLRVLDLSITYEDFSRGDENLFLGDIILETILNCDTFPWPDLRCLDMTGDTMLIENYDRNLDGIQKLVEKCPRIHTICLMDTIFDRIEFNFDTVWVVNCVTPSKAIEAFGYYSRTEVNASRLHVQEHILDFLVNQRDSLTEEETIRSIEMIFVAMRIYLQCRETQFMCANYFREIRDRVLDRLSPWHVQKFVNHCLNAAANWKNDQKVQGIIWWTLCHYQVLSSPGLQLAIICDMALRAFVQFDSKNLHIIVLAIISVIVQKFTVPEKLKVINGQHIVYIVHILNAEMEEEIPNLQLIREALLTLRSITDECAYTCDTVVKAGLLETCKNILTQHAGDSNMEEKVFGVLLNICEMRSFPTSLCEDENLFKTICNCMDGDFSNEDKEVLQVQLERSSTAAGIISILLSTGLIALSLEKAVDDHLQRVIVDWPDPTFLKEMFSFRTFELFEHILKETKHDGPRNYCLWMLLHVLPRKDGGPPLRNYPEMVRSSPLLKTLEEMKIGNPKMGEYLERILDTVKK